MWSYRDSLLQRNYKGFQDHSFKKNGFNSESMIVVTIHFLFVKSDENCFLKYKNLTIVKHTLALSTMVQKYISSES